jgi:hypothetical protein
MQATITQNEWEQTGNSNFPQTATTIDNRFACKDTPFLKE